jgi:CubicO group peptidase (beta-lactamase class C family)
MSARIAPFPSEVRVPNITRRAALASALAALVARDARAATGTEPFEQLLTKFVSDNGIPGAAVAVSRAGKLAFAAGFGLADRAAKAPVKPDALFRIASISKPITAVGVMQLNERGKLKLDDPVRKYLSLKPALADGAKFDARWDAVTIRHCLQHTGGWDRGAKGGFDPIAWPWRVRRALELNGPPTADDVVRYILGRPLDFAPGERFAYSNVGYLVLGRVIETVTKQSYESFTKKEVLAPAGVTRAVLARGVPEARPAAEVRYYDSKPRTGPCLYPPRADALVPLPDGAENVEAFEAHGGWVASAVDLVRFACAFDYGTKSPLLSAASIGEMWAAPPNAGKDVWYGCGWSVRPAGRAGRANVWHTGLIAGTSALLVRRHDGLNWAVLFNTDATSGGAFAAGAIDGPLHGAADAVRAWPEEDQFARFR